MTIFSLILGILIGGISVVFILQNITPITVSFFAWQIQGSLALLLFLALGVGIFMTLLFLLPSLIRDELAFSRMRKEKEKAEAAAAAAVAPSPAILSEATQTPPNPAA